MTLPLTEPKQTSDETSEVGNEHISELELAGTADAISPIADACLRALSNSPTSRVDGTVRSSDPQLDKKAAKDRRGRACFAVTSEVNGSNPSFGRSERGINDLPRLPADHRDVDGSMVVSSYGDRHMKLGRDA
jgi:hypothetical protein